VALSQLHAGASEVEGTGPTESASTAGDGPDTVGKSGSLAIVTHLSSSPCGRRRGQE
jgi:hypothetical protein